MKTPEAHLGGIQLDGAFKKIPGYAAGANTGDKWPFVIQSGLLTFVTGTALLPAIAPFDYTVLGAILLVKTQLTVAASTLDIGVNGTAKKFLADYSVLTSYTAGQVIDLTSSLTATLTGSQGDLFSFDPGNTASAGDGHVALIIAPRI